MGLGLGLVRALAPERIGTGVGLLHSLTEATREGSRGVVEHRGRAAIDLVRVRVRVGVGVGVGVGVRVGVRVRVRVRARARVRARVRDRRSH